MKIRSKSSKGKRKMKKREKAVSVRCRKKLLDTDGKEEGKRIRTKTEKKV